ncbi:MAG TPA: BTAD domain-containing putative transcriptional regulator [Actinomycetota bacterium]
MTLEIRLLGTPMVLRDGVAQPPPRGAKAWALLAYLLLERGAGNRVRLASLLFGDAEDPLAALRWNLNALRRLVGDPLTFRGDPVDPLLPANTRIDVLMLRSGSWPDALELAGLGLELLDGLSVSSSPGFDAWLAAERRRVAGDSCVALRGSALARLAGDDGGGACELAARLIAIDPYDEASHELLVRSLMADRRDADARAHLDRAIRLLRDELGIEPSQELLGACDPPDDSSSAPNVPSIRAAMQSGYAAVLAGQTSGLRPLRRAVSDARALGDETLLLKTLLLLGTSLSFTESVGGEGEAASMHEAIALAERLGSPRLLAHAHRELAYSEYWRAHYDRAHVMVDQVEAHTEDDRLETARSLTLRGAILTETAHYPEALALLQEALSLLDQQRTPGDTAFALTMLGRLHLLRGSLDAAAATLESASVLVRSHWTTLVPWVESFLGEVALKRGEIAEAARLLEHAYALACLAEGNGRCQTLAARGLGSLSAAKDDIPAAVHWFDVARTRGSRTSDYFAWFRAYALEALCDLAVSRHLPGASTWISALEEAAGRHGMRDLLARALCHRGRLGDAQATEAARSLGADIDSPALHELLGA